MLSIYARVVKTPTAAAWLGSAASPFAQWLGRAQESASTAMPLERVSAAATMPDAASDCCPRPTSGEPATVGAVWSAGEGRQHVAPILHGQASAQGAVTDGAYWPSDRLNAFILRMAARGHCVSAAMMLGHRAYAQVQLAAARQVHDRVLQELVEELQAYFDASEPIKS